jgi:hypothetical protein
MGGACCTHGEIRNAYKFFTGRPDVKRLFGKYRHKIEDNIKVYQKKV